jgi:hypothetical protein
MTDDVDQHLAAAGDEEVVHTFDVRARFRRAAADAGRAEAGVRDELEPVRSLHDDVVVEPQELDGRWPVDVRFVVASLDGELAVQGVLDALAASGLVPDEAWVAERLP